MQLGRLEVTIKGLFLALGVAGLVSCGSGDDATGAGGSCGNADESGICLQVALIDPFNIDSEFTSDVDVNLVVCDPGPPAVIEDFTEHFAEVTFNAFPVSQAVAASFVQVTGMIVTFTQNTTDPLVTCTNPTAASAPCDAVPGPGPAIATLTTPINVVIPVGTSVTQTMPMVNFQRKDDFTPALDFDIFTDGPFDPSGLPAFLSYNVRFTFTGEDEFGQNVDATAATELTFGAYNNC